MADPVTLPPLPAPLAWEVAPAHWSLEDALTIAAPARTDLFRDPAGGEPQSAAPRLLGPVAAAFDAGALLLWADERRWVKLAFEVSPDGEPGVVSVATDGLSDDANAFAATCTASRRPSEVTGWSSWFS